MIFSYAIKLTKALLLSLLVCVCSYAATSHTVRKGESLSSISSRYGVSVKAIMSYNRLSNPNVIREGQVLKIPSSEPTNFEYTIKKGDSLSSIAKKYGTNATAISKLNGIRNANRIAIGQVIKIPSSSSSPNTNTYSFSALPSSVKSSLDRIAVRGGWKHIVIHHTATDRDNAKNMDRYHRDERKMENGLAYHFVIGNGRGMKNGEIYIGDRWKRQIQGGHLKSYSKNQVAIGICLVGNFEKRPPSSKQLEQLEALIHYLMKRTDVHHSGVTTHKVIHPNHTLCPGKKFPTNSFLKKFE